MALYLRATGRHLPYGITQRYLQPDTSERAPPNPSHAGRYSIYLPRRDGRLSWGDLIVPRPGVEPATLRSRVRRQTAAPPRQPCIVSVASAVVISLSCQCIAVHSLPARISPTNRLMAMTTTSASRHSNVREREKMSSRKYFSKSAMNFAGRWKHLLQLKCYRRWTSVSSSSIDIINSDDVTDDVTPEYKYYEEQFSVYQFFGVFTLYNCTALNNFCLAPCGVKNTAVREVTERHYTRSLVVYVMSIRST